MKRIGTLLLLLLSMTNAQAGKELAQSLIGHEYTGAPPGWPLPGRPGCTIEGGATIFVRHVEQDGWAEEKIRCGKRWVLALQRYSKAPLGEFPKEKIIDAVELPFDLRSQYSEHSEWEVYPNGPCTFDGRRGTAMDVVLRWRGRKRVDHRTGIKQAWGFDLKQGKIVPLDISRIRCERIEVD